MSDPSDVVPTLMAPVRPHVIVLFGATGDLARRKLLPGLLHLSRAGLIPECRIVGTSLDEIDDEAFRRFARQACEEFASRGVSEEQWEDFERTLRYVPQDGGPDRAGRGRRQGGRRARWRAPPAALPEHPADRGAERRADPAGGRPRRPGADHHGEAVRHRPGQRPRPQRLAARDLRRGADLPDRPLPGEGGGPEHPRLPLRQRPVRADLEPRPHRPRADRRARGAVARLPARLLREDRRLPGHGRDPPVPGAGVHGDGAADRAGARRDQRGEEQGVPLDAADRAEPRRAGPVRRLPRRAGRGGGLRHRDLHRPPLRDRQLALGRCAVLPAHGQAHGRGRAHHLDRLPRAAQEHVPGRLRASARTAPTTSPSTWPTPRSCRSRSTASGRGRG